MGPKARAQGPEERPRRASACGAASSHSSHSSHSRRPSARGSTAFCAHVMGSARGANLLHSRARRRDLPREVRERDEGDEAAVRLLVGGVRRLG